MADVYIKKGEGRSFKSGGMWFYDNEIDRIEGKFENGDIIDVLDFDGYYLGRGFINTNSKITLSLSNSTVSDTNLSAPPIPAGWLEFLPLT